MATNPNGFPPADEYQRALMNPHLSFADPMLKQARVQTNALGLPVTWSGQFATVFRAQTPRGVRAVRCFTAQVTDHEVRYARLHAHMDSRPLPMLADFAYQERGILVRGQWLPIVNMEWVEGEPLDRRVEQAGRTGDRAALAELAGEWAHVVAALHAAQVAHGDLQHDNILVDRRGIRLVDYDGVYVPALGNRRGLEVGHPHYQHPRRTLDDYGPGIDNFPALVIYLSLKALAADPSLWQRYHTDKHLILRSDDYRAPHRSPLVIELSKSRDAEINRLTLELVSACGRPPLQAPELPALLTGAQHVLGDWRKTWPTPEPVLVGRHAPAAAATAASAAASAVPRAEPRKPAARPAPPANGRAAAPPPVPVRSAPPPVTLVQPYPWRERLAGAWEGALDWVRVVQPAPPASAGVAIILLLLFGGGSAIALAYMAAIGVAPLAGMLLMALLAPTVYIATRQPVVAAAALFAALAGSSALLGTATTDWLIFSAAAGFLAALPFVGSNSQPLTDRLVMLAIAIAGVCTALARGVLLGEWFAAGDLIGAALVAVAGAYVAIVAGKALYALHRALT